jgi:hypothetical protein
MAYYLESVPAGYNLGIYNCRPIRGTSTRLSVHSEGRAIDAGIPTDGHAGMYAWLDALAPHAGKLGLCYIIFDRRKYRTANPCGTGYYGSNPHTDHAHIELTRTAAEKLTLATLRAVVGDFRDNPLGDDDMKELIARRQAVLVRAGFDLGDFTPYLPAGDPDSLPGCDGVYGDLTRSAEDDLAAEALAQGDGYVPTEIYEVHRHSEGTTGPPR